MDELEILKKDWKKNENTFNQVTEKEIYKALLSDPDTEVSGTVKELAEKYKITVMTMTGFSDGTQNASMAIRLIRKISRMNLCHF